VIFGLVGTFLMITFYFLVIFASFYDTLCLHKLLMYKLRVCVLNISSLCFFFFFFSIFFECQLTYAHPHGMNCSVYGDIVLVTKVVLVNESRTAFLLTLLWL
jgi:hypothetical protein